MVYGMEQDAKRRKRDRAFAVVLVLYFLGWLIYGWVFAVNHSNGDLGRAMGLGLVMTVSTLPDAIATFGVSKSKRWGFILLIVLCGVTVFNDVFQQARYWNKGVRYDFLATIAFSLLVILYSAFRLRILNPSFPGVPTRKSG